MSGASPEMLSLLSTWVVLEVVGNLKGKLALSSAVSKSSIFPTFLIIADWQAVSWLFLLKVSYNSALPACFPFHIGMEEEAYEEVEEEAPKDETEIQHQVEPKASTKKSDSAAIKKFTRFVLVSLPRLAV
ncbi:hypothetical protein C3L33_09684, partial [Rhododendron williamsianum]